MSVIPPFLYQNTPSEKFCPMSTDIDENKTFQKLTFGAKYLYKTICASVFSDYERKACKAVILNYAELGYLCNDDGTPFSDGDIIEKIGGKLGKNHTLHTKWFICPDAFTKKWGLPASTACKLKKELIEKGFIEVVCEGKGRYCGYTKNATIYKFSDKWKMET